MKEPSLYLITV